MKKRKLFCEISPLCYKLSLIKESFFCSIKDLFSKIIFAKTYGTDILPITVKGHRSEIMRKLNNVDPKLQKNKAQNLLLAGQKINKLLILPGETFSFWHTVGNPTAKKGYKNGLVISGSKLEQGVGGGLCQLANLIHWLVLNSPLTVTELHHHTDALFPDSNRRIPFGTGTSVLYKHIDYRFKNNTDQPVQLLIWQTETELFGELRAEKPYKYKYRLTEEEHFYSKEEDGYYRNSKIYRLVFDENSTVTDKQLILVNHSKVMYDASLIPQNEIKITV